MEICETSLDKIIKTEDLDVNRKLDILCQIANGIKGIHSLGMTHRDIKPENIFVNRVHYGSGFQIKLGDFGTSKDDVLTVI